MASENYQIDILASSSNLFNMPEHIQDPVVSSDILSTQPVAGSNAEKWFQSAPETLTLGDHALDTAKIKQSRVGLVEVNAHFLLFIAVC